MTSTDVSIAIAAVERFRAAPTDEHAVLAAAALAELPAGTWVVVGDRRYRAGEAELAGQPGLVMTEEEVDADDTADYIPF